ncbi:hypothetical protein PUATCC27989T_04832 [Phytobacter ursingii]|uniref:Uncharacterized protein n=1 Tax=Phytobacter ursingii TaxID=1972431 RepID=A0AB35RHU6_9ENTR|nr:MULTISPECIES: hypothetical protein [Enterobacteriaceae]MDV2861410.1 hypothetical protein [Phytobacter ursingii]VTP16854.1 hypothetical protein PUATCC27989T_04832 [Phytobacter ursingii]
MDANQVILSVLTKKDLFYLKNRYLQMRKNARAATRHQNERERLPFVILSLAEFCSSGNFLFLVVFVSAIANAVFRDEIIKGLIITGFIIIITFFGFLYVDARQTRFPSMLILKMFLIRVKCLRYKIPVPQSLPDDWEINWSI